MADTSPKKKVAAKPKKPAAHPKYSEMVGKAIAALKESQTNHTEEYYGQLQCWKRRQDCKCSS
jgi:hypothetical protein